MANVRICDRCGKKLEFGKKYSIVNRVYAHRFTVELTHYDKDYDLCPDCKKDFDVFMQGPSEGCTAETKE